MRFPVDYQKFMRSKASKSSKLTARDLWILSLFLSLSFSLSLSYSQLLQQLTQRNMHASTVNDARPSLSLTSFTFVCNEACVNVDAYYAPIRLVNYSAVREYTCHRADMDGRLKRKFQAVIQHFVWIIKVRGRSAIILGKVNRAFFPM